MSPSLGVTRATEPIARFNVGFAAASSVDWRPFAFILPHEDSAFGASQDAAMAARRRAAGLAANALFAADEGDNDGQPGPAETDVVEEEEAERRYRLELSREVQVRHRPAVILLLDRHVSLTVLRSCAQRVA